MPRKSAAVKPDTELAPSGHNSQVTDDALIAENNKLEDEIKAGTAKLNEWAAPKKARIEEIEGELRKRLTERGSDSTRTDSGTAYFSHLMNTKIEDQAALFDFIAEHWEEVGDEAKLNIKIDAVKQHMEQNDGRPPPGMSVSYFTRLNIKRS